MNIRLLFLFFSVAIIGFYSCKKTNGDVAVSNSLTYLDVINASADTLNVYQNGTRLNIGSNLLPSGQYANLIVKTGDQNYQFKRSGNPTVIAETKFNLLDTTAYTMFVAGESADKVFLLRDTIVSDTTARIRFVNASPDAGSLDFTIASKTFKSRAFKSATPFVSVLAGKVVYSIYRQDIGALLASGTLTLAKGASYTLFSKGLINGKGTALLGARMLITSTN